MISSARKDRFANANTQPRRAVVRIVCEATIADLSKVRPVFVSSASNIAVEMQTPCGSFLPRVVPFADIDAALLRRLEAGVVMSCLVCQTFDALDLAALLSRSDYGGRYIALSCDIPNPKMVLREVTAKHPRVDFSLMPATVIRRHG